MNTNKLVFSRVDLLQVGQLARKTCHMLPLEKRSRIQKIVVGDETGSILCFGMKKGDPSTVFKTNPSPPQNKSKNKIARLFLTGPKGVKDRIFYINEHSVAGVSKKGKEFFRFETNLTEPLKSLFVDDLDLYLSGDHIFSHFYETQDKDFYMCNDLINDMICMYISTDDEMDAVLACQDRFIRVISRSEVIYNIPLNGPATVLYEFQGDSQTFINDRRVLYGTANGILGSVLINNTTFTKEWEISDSQDVTLGGIISLTVCDLMEEGHFQAVIGRDCGSIDIYMFMEGYHKVPTKIFHTSINESIQSIDHGTILAPKYHEIMVATFSGKISSYSPDPSNVSSSVEISDEMKEKMYYSRDESELKRRIRGVENDISKLQDKITKELERKKKFGTSLIEPGEPLPSFDVNSHFLLRPSDACYLLSLETKSPLDCIVLRSDVPLDISEGGNAVSLIARTQPNPKEGNYLLATCRVGKDSFHRCEIRVRPIEGKHGTLTAYIIPNITPRGAYALHFPIGALSLHQQVNEIPDLDQRPLNGLKVKGSFSVPEIHSWVAMCLPELPEKVSGDSVTFHFRSTFAGTVLVAHYSQGEAIFKSDSIFSISVLKECISHEAILRKARINIALSIKSESINFVLDLLHPKVEYQFRLAHKIKIIDSIRELSQQESEVPSVLPKHYKNLLDNDVETKVEFQQLPYKLEFLFEAIVELLRVKMKFKGKNSATHEEELRQLLQNYNLDEIKNFFSRHNLN